MWKVNAKINSDSEAGVGGAGVVTVEIFFKDWKHGSQGPVSNPKGTEPIQIRNCVSWRTANSYIFSV